MLPSRKRMVMREEGKEEKDDPMWKMGVSQQVVKTQPRSNGRTKETGNLITY